MNYRSMTNPVLVSKSSPARVAEAQHRLDSWDMKAKNVALLTLFVETATRKVTSKMVITKHPAKVAPAKKADSKPASKTTSRKVAAKTVNSTKASTIDKKACWNAAEANAKANGIPVRSAEFWVLYKAETAAAREALA